MAGAGYKLYSTGDVLSATDVNEYLQQQTVMVFASAAARTSALSAVLAEGMISYLQDTNAVQVYNGSAWVAVGGSSPLTTKGDLYGFSTLDARVPIGANDTVLTADSAQALGLKWAAPSSGGMTLINSGGTTLSGSSVVLSSIPATYVHLQLVVRSMLVGTDSELYLRLNGDSGSNYGLTTSNDITNIAVTTTGLSGGEQQDNTLGTGSVVWDLYDYASTTSKKMTVCYGIYNNLTTPANFNMSRYFTYWNNNDAVNSITIYPNRGGTFTSGTAFLYGVK
jgi:hypothetical protein